MQHNISNMLAQDGKSCSTTSLMCWLRMDVKWDRKLTLKEDIINMNNFVAFIDAELVFTLHLVVITTVIKKETS